VDFGTAQQAKYVQLIGLEHGRHRLCCWGLCTYETQLPLLGFSTRSVFFSVLSGVFIEICIFYSGEILEMHVVLLYFPLKNAIVSQA